MKKLIIGIFLLFGTQAFAIEINQFKVGHVQKAVAIAPSTIVTGNGKSITTTMNIDGIIVLEGKAMRQKETFSTELALKQFVKLQLCGQKQEMTGNYERDDDDGYPNKTFHHSENFTLTEVVNRVYVLGVDNSGKEMKGWFSCSSL